MSVNIGETGVSLAMCGESTRSPPCLQQWNLLNRTIDGSAAIHDQLCGQEDGDERDIQSDDRCRVLRVYVRHHFRKMDCGEQEAMTNFVDKVDALGNEQWRPGDCPMCKPPSSCPGGAHRNALAEDGIDTPTQSVSLPLLRLSSRCSWWAS